MDLGSPMDRIDYVDYLTRRKDEKVCCSGNGRWFEGMVDGLRLPTARYCHDPSAALVDYSEYTTCESVCTRQGVPDSQYYSLCKNAVSGSKRATMTATPSSETEANQKA